MYQNTHPYHSLIPSLSRHVFILSSVIHRPLSSYIPLHCCGSHSFFFLSSLSPNPALFPRAHSQCIIQVEIPACRVQPLKIHGDAALRPFSAAYTSEEERHGLGQRGAGRTEEGRREGEGRSAAGEVRKLEQKPGGMRQGAVKTHGSCFGATST